MSIAAIRHYANHGEMSSADDDDAAGRELFRVLSEKSGVNQEHLQSLFGGDLGINGHNQAKSFIKLYDWVVRLAATPMTATALPIGMSTETYQEIVRSLRESNKIQAIKTARAALMCGLKEAKDWVESLTLPVSAQLQPSDQLNEYRRVIDAGHVTGNHEDREIARLMLRHPNVVDVLFSNEPFLESFKQTLLWIVSGNSVSSMNDIRELFKDYDYISGKPDIAHVRQVYQLRQRLEETRQQFEAIQRELGELESK